ncbi:MAG: A/G-specific adenine glycosylase [Thermoplasmata archaeon]
MPKRVARSIQSADEVRARELLGWYSHHRRPLPWRCSPSPYRTWIAEALLQQTRVEQAVPYYQRFIARFPDVRTLARAPMGSVLKTWQGAGYYARARNLHAAAREIVRRHDGILPSTVTELEALPGIGPYIARAIASLAFGRPVVALEANGRRVAIRWWADRGDPSSPRTARRLTRRLEAMLPAGDAGSFNEAVMELGETICLPRAPVCPKCPVRRYCRAYHTLPNPGALPRPKGRTRRPHVIGAVVVAERGGRVLVQRRPMQGLLGGLYEFPGGKVEPGEATRAAAAREWREETRLPTPSLTSVGIVRHAYSHFSVELHVYRTVLGASRRWSVIGGTQRWVRWSGLARLPIPKATEKILALIAADPRSRLSRA